MQTFQKIEETHSYDICVVGGGISGICAAISAARNGSKTVLIQDRPMLGGNASSEVRMWICGAPGADNKEAGIVEELQIANLFHNSHLNYELWDHTLYSKVIEEDNLDLFLNTSVIDTIAENETITKIKAWQLTSQKWLTFEAKVFIDCSGDSILRYCGAEFMKGKDAKTDFKEDLAEEERNPQTMGNSILLQFKDTPHHTPYEKPAWAYSFTEEELDNRHTKITQRNNFWWIEYGGMLDTISDAEPIREKLLKIALGIWEFIKNHPDGRGHKWELAWIGTLPGKRENIRYIGEYVLNQNDLESNQQFADAIAHGGWPMDDHPSEGFYFKGKPTVFHKTPPNYHIPYRCLYSKNIKNLFFAGRNISASHMALSSTRVMGTCGLLGQAAGTAAALTLQESCFPHELYSKHMDKLQRTLMRQDQWIPHFYYELSGITKTAQNNFSPAEKEILLNQVEREKKEEVNSILVPDQQVCEFTWENKQTIKNIRFILESEFGYNKQMPCIYLHDAQPVCMPKKLMHSMKVSAKNANGQWELVREINKNTRRHLELNTDLETNAIKIEFIKSWGGESSGLYSIDFQ